MRPQVLRVHANAIKSFEDVSPIEGFKRLHRLTLMNNPLDQHRDYRHLACALVPSLKQFDNVLITASEGLKIASYRSSPRGVKEINSIRRARVNDSRCG